MGKNTKKKKKKPAPDKNVNKTGKIHTETEENKQMTQEEKSKKAAEEVMEEAAKETEEKAEQGEAEEVKEEAAEEEQQEAAGEQPEEKEGEAAETQEGQAEEEGSADSGEDDEAKGYFKKKKEKKEKKNDLLADLTDKLQRQMAEFENFRKRTDKEKATMYDMGTRDTVEKLLPVVDNFERGLAEAKEDDPFAEGMKMIYKQLMTMLTDLGVTPIEAEGKEFDPNLHNAVMHVDDDSFGENVVAQELQKGYMFKDHVVRHSMVKVAN